MLGEREQRVVVVVLLEIDLDRNVVRDSLDDAVDGGLRGAVTDQQVAGRPVLGGVGNRESARPHHHHGDGRAGLDGGRPGGGRARRVRAARRRSRSVRSRDRTPRGCRPAGIRCRCPRGRETRTAAMMSGRCSSPRTRVGDTMRIRRQCGASRSVPSTVTSWSRAPKPRIITPWSPRAIGVPPSPSTDDSTSAGKASLTWLQGGPSGDRLTDTARRPPISCPCRRSLVQAGSSPRGGMNADGCEEARRRIRQVACGPVLCRCGLARGLRCPVPASRLAEAPRTVARPARPPRIRRHRSATVVHRRARVASGRPGRSRLRRRHRPDSMPGCRTPLLDPRFPRPGRRAPRAATGPAARSARRIPMQPVRPSNLAEADGRSRTCTPVPG